MDLTRLISIESQPKKVVVVVVIVFVFGLVVVGCVVVVVIVGHRNLNLKFGQNWVNNKWFVVVVVVVIDVVVVDPETKLGICCNLCDESPGWC